MKVLVVGGGGREHALAWKVAQSPRVTKLYCAPGNPGIARLAECVPLAADDLAGLRDFARRQRIDLTVIGPEAPLAAGIVDEFRKDKLPIFGPHKAAAHIEASKAFSKDLMVRLGIPTADAQTFTAVGPALAYVALIDVGEGRADRRERLRVGGGNAQPDHQVFGERLARLDVGGRLVRTEDG